MNTTPFRELEAEALAAMTPDEHAEFDAAHDEEEARLRLAEMVYFTRTEADPDSSDAPQTRSRRRLTLHVELPKAG